MIRRASNSYRIDGNGAIDLEVVGPKIWLNAGCGPLKIGIFYFYSTMHGEIWWQVQCLPVH
jgi:hypothetical protein